MNRSATTKPISDNDKSKFYFATTKISPIYPHNTPYINKAIERALQTRKTNKDMAMAMALRRLASSIDKPIRPLFNGASLYYMVLSLYLSFYF